MIIVNRCVSWTAFIHLMVCPSCMQIRRTERLKPLSVSHSLILRHDISNKHIIIRLNDTKDRYILALNITVGFWRHSGDFTLCIFGLVLDPQ